MRTLLPLPPLIRLPALVLLTAIVTMGSVGWLLVNDLHLERAEALEDAQVHSANLASAFEKQLLQLVRRVDETLVLMRREYKNSPDTFREEALQWRTSPFADLVVQITIIGPDGKLVFSNIDPSATNIDLSDREHFIVHRDGTKDELFISKPVLGRISREWSLQFTRRIDDDQGRFAGVIVARVGVDTLSELYSSVEVGQQGAVSLFGMDRVLRARGSRVMTAQAPIGIEVPNLPHFDPASPLAGPVDIYSKIDHVHRIGAYQRMANYPLLIIVSFGIDEVLADFYQAQQRIYSGAALVLVFALISFGAVAWLAWREALSAQALDKARRHQASENERWRLALEAVGDGVWDWQVQTGSIYYSPRWKAILGYDEAEIRPVLEEWRSRVHPDDVARVNSDLNALLDGSTRFYTNEHRIRCKDGNYKWVLDRGVVVADDEAGTPLRAVGTYTDITAKRLGEDALRQKSQALEQSNQELEAFAYAASHDLRQPLRTVSSFIKLLERELGDRLSADAAEFMGFIREGAQRMDRLIVDLLEYSRIGRLYQGIGRFPAGEIIDEALANLRLAIEESGGTVTLDSPLPLVYGDRSELVRLFQNLLGNALKYRAPDRPPRIVIRACPADTGTAEKPVWEFSVQDNGIGIAPEHAQRIFGIFQRLHPGDAYEGSGIGLAICRKIVQRLGGNIWLDVPTGDEPAESGCDFHFTLPDFAPPGENPRV